MAAHEFRFPSTLAAEQELVRRLRSLMESSGVDGASVRRFLLIVSEVFTNAVIHGNKSDSNREIVVHFAINEAGLSADIIDQGRGGLDRIRRRPKANLLSEGGRGIDIVCHCATDVEFAETEQGGLIVSVRLDCRRKKKAIERSVNS